MTFVARLGRSENLRDFRSSVEAHALWARSSVRERTESTIEGRFFSCAWFVRGESDEQLPLSITDREIRLTTRSGAGSSTADADGSSANLVSFRVDRLSGTLVARMPHATPEPLFWLRLDDAIVLTNDFRLAVRFAGRSVDPTGAYAMLVFGVIPPPLTLIRGVQRVPWGHELRISNSLEPILVPIPPQLAKYDVHDERSAEDRISEALDGSVERAPKGSLLYFSGGVDSALIATRLRALGRTDVELFHFSFREGDPETDVAQQIANHLGLTMRTVQYEPDHVPSMLSQIGEDYSFPFADFSSIPTNLLVKASLDGRPHVRAILEGTGADGAFGVGVKEKLWDRMLRVPSPLRRAVARTLTRPVLRPWLFAPRTDRVYRIAVRSITLPPALAAVGSQNTLDGVAYDVPPETLHRLIGAISDRIESLVGGRSFPDRISWIDLVLICAGQFAPKSFGVLSARHVEPMYPFLEPALLRAAFSMEWAEKSRGGDAKAVLKKMLAREVPRELVYRPKIGFQPPFQMMLRMPALRPFVEAALDRNRNPLLDLSRPAVVRQMFDDARTGDRPLTLGALALLWVHLFVTLWIDQTG